MTSSSQYDYGSMGLPVEVWVVNVTLQIPYKDFVGYFLLDSDTDVLKIIDNQKNLINKPLHVKNFGIKKRCESIKFDISLSRPPNSPLYRIKFLTYALVVKHMVVKKTL